MGDSPIIALFQYLLAKHNFATKIKSTLGGNDQSGFKTTG